MPRHQLRLLVASVLSLVLVSVFLPTSALAHERRTVGGKYVFVVGFLNEPAVQGQMNGISLQVTTVSDSKPVEGLEKTLKAELVVGGGARTMPVDLEARFGQPGAYAANFIPTKAGAYIFRFTGTVEGTAVDERFESGPGRFDDVISAQSLEFPDKLPNPSTTASDVQAAKDEAASARLLGIAGLGVGLVGVALGGVALATRRRGDGVSASQAKNG